MRLIDAENLWLTTEYTEDGNVHKYYEQWEVDEAPTIDAEPVRHGKWTECEYENGINFHRCSVCGQLDMYQGIFTDSGDRGFIFYYKRQYCPNCGAKMDEETT